MIPRALIAFFLFHAAAVALYSIPREGVTGFPQALRAASMPIVSPYLLRTAQWQVWNLFAPDPLRRETEAALFGRTAEGEPRLLLDFTVAETSWWQRAKRFKLLRRVSENEQLLHAFVLRQCDLSPVSIRTVWMEIRTRIVPHPREVRARGGWATIEQPWQTRVVGPLPC